MKIGLLSGTFDPVHSGHVAMAYRAIDDLALEQVWLLPEEQPRNKADVTPYRHRVAMLKIVVSDSPNLQVIEVERPVHSVALLREFSIGTPHDFYILVGSDIADTIDQWEEIDEIRKLAKIITVGRGDERADIDLGHPASSAQVRKQLVDGIQPADIDPRVLDYIHEHNLYQDSAPLQPVS